METLKTGSGSFLSHGLSFLSLSQEYSFVAGCDKNDPRVGFVAACDKNDRSFIFVAKIYLISKKLCFKIAWLNNTAR